MSKIKVLPEELVNKIAAGEVVERPASVVKELIENSIDAQSTKISVEVQSAGKKLIRVSDNGIGMSKKELELSFERHSTSKINQYEDLFNISSLGFRGEALPSIASIAELEIVSCQKDNNSGAKIIINGGKKQATEDCGTPIGTTIIIKNIFFNTPARKKFLKANATELGHIGNIISKYVMAYPNISFEFISDGKPLLHSTGSGKLKDAILAVYGISLSKDLIEVNATFAQGKIFGLVSQPTITRLDKNYETFFVNGRYIKNFLLNRALEDAYRTLIPHNRYPVAVLFIEINPKLIDVNVHPTKKEVKFSKTNEVMEAIRTAVAKSLEKILDKKVPLPKQENYVPFSNENAWQAGMTEVFFGEKDTQPLINLDIKMEVTDILPVVPIYQFKNTYIVATDGESLVLIDQHAAHERIIYDQLTKQAEQKTSQAQALLVPETIELETKFSLLLQENIDYFNNLGFSIEDFGKNSYLLRSVPALSAKTGAKQLLLDLLAELSSLGKTSQLEIRQENIRKLVACHSAIKANDPLNQEEMKQLIRDLFVTENPLTCPHGRPTMIKLSEQELAKRFGR